MNIIGNMQDRLRPFMQTAGNGGGSAEVIAPDISTLSDEDLKKLENSDEQLVKDTLQGKKIETPTPETDDKDKGETTEQKAAREAAEAAAAASKANEAETPEQKTAREAKESADKGEKLFAGKYKTKEELINGFVNSAKALNYNPKLLEKMAALALKTGDVEVIEEVYKDLELAIASNNKANALPGQPPPAGPKPDTSEKSERDTSNLPTKMDDAVRQEATRLTLQGALSDLRSSRIVARMERQGISLPEGFIIDPEETKKFLANLESELPWMYDLLENELTSLVQKHAKEVNETIQAMESAKVDNPKRRESEIAKIKAEAQAMQLPVKDEELVVFVEDTLKQPWVYETRNGIQFIRENAIMDAWYLKNRDAIKKQIQLNSEITGRTQAVNDIDKNRKKMPNSISNSTIPSDQGSRREKAGTVDLTDPNVLASLPDDELNALLKDDDKREKLRPKN